MIGQLLQQLNLTSIGLIALLVIAFVLAFKIMEMIFETFLISGISAAFYVGLSLIQGGGIQINDLLLFTFLGAALYLAYSLIASAYKLGSTVIPIPFNIVKIVLKPFIYTLGKIKGLYNSGADFAPDKPNAKAGNEKENKEKKNQSTKEVVLGNKSSQEDE